MGYQQNTVHRLQAAAVCTSKSDAVTPGPQEKKQTFSLFFFFFKRLCSLATERGTMGKQSDLYQIALVSF